MAYTVSHLVSEGLVFGNKRVKFIRVTADAATGTVSTGLDHIDSVSVALQSASTGAVKFAMNEGATGTSTAGTIGVTGAASGDEFVLTVFGR